MLVSPAAARKQPTSSYLANYPYLFVRETDQTDYLCTVCQETFTEDHLQSHLFQGHSATNIQDCFVRLKHTGSKERTLVSCVLCWAKMETDAEMNVHREACRSTVCDEELERNEMIEPTSLESSPDMDDMLEDEDRETNGVSPPPFPQPEVIIDTEVGEKYDPSSDTLFLQSNKMNGGMLKEPVYSSQCMQCSLCSMILPSTSYLSHLRAYHRVTCPLNNINCPLCMTCVPIMDLTVHLASQHGLVPQTAVNALLLWVLTSNTFSLNEAAQESLKSKFKPSVSIQTKPKPSVTSTPLTSTSSVKTSPAVPSPGVYKPAVPDQETTLLNDLRGKVPVEKLLSKLTRSHLGTGGKQSHQCLVCAKWYAVPPLRHMRSHIFNFRQEKRKMLQLTNNVNICLICYRIFESQQGVAGHLATHTQVGNSGSSPAAVSHITIPGLPGGSVTPVTSSVTSTSGGLLAEALLGYPVYTKAEQKPDAGETEDITLSSTSAESVVSPTITTNTTTAKEEVNVELDNAGRVKSGKVRKQCELCGEWSNIKWFFKHMSEVHQALFCRCCREYLPKDEHKEHRHWHGMPPYMGQKIRIEDGQPIIIDRKERASLTPIGSLAAWGGSSGGLVVKAVDEMNKKRKVDRVASPGGSTVKPAGISSNGDSSFTQGRESLMPKERCPVCAIEITHKNLARHIKLRHGIKYKFCYKCRKLVPGDLYEEHRSMHESGELPTVNGGVEYLDNLQGGEDGMIEIPEEVLDEVMETNGGGLRKKDDSFRANTSMTKLESLMGREFKHPRRQCTICGYSVSYSNYKRHLRNAHPGIIDESQKDDSGGDNDADMVGHHIDDSDRIEDNRGASEDEDEDEEDAEEDKDDVEGYSECTRCGDHVMSEFMDSHLKKVHGESGSKSGSPRPRNLKLRPCPECGQEMREDCVIKHCKVKHKVIYRLCPACSKYIPKKLIRVHLRLHEKGDLDGKVDELKADLEDGTGGSEQEEQDQQKQVSRMTSAMSLAESDEADMIEEDLSNGDKDDLDPEDKLVIDSV